MQDNNILCLDEATSNLDDETSLFITRIIVFI